jgi:hypothetical protein
MGILPAVTGMLPAVTGVLPAVTGILPAVTGMLPAVTGMLPAVMGILPVRRGNISDSRHTGMKMPLRFQIDPIVLKEITVYLKIGKTVMATVHTGRA